MSEPGTIAWVDLTVANAENLRDFYTAVVGWECEALEVGDYSDFVMRPAGGGAAVAGICHAQGVNQGLPPQWMVHITVADLDASLARCQELGGKVRAEPFQMGTFGRMAVIEDPAGAVAALLQPTP